MIHINEFEGFLNDGHFYQMPIISDHILPGNIHQHQLWVMTYNKDLIFSWESILDCYNWGFRVLLPVVTNNSD